MIAKKNSFRDITKGALDEAFRAKKQEEFISYQNKKVLESSNLMYKKRLVVTYIVYNSSKAKRKKLVVAHCLLLPRVLTILKSFKISSRK